MKPSSVLALVTVSLATAGCQGATGPQAAPPATTTIRTTVASSTTPGTTAPSPPPSTPSETAAAAPTSPRTTPSTSPGPRTSASAPAAPRTTRPMGPGIRDTNDCRDSWPGDICLAWSEGRISTRTANRRARAALADVAPGFLEAYPNGENALYCADGSQTQDACPDGSYPREKPYPRSTRAYRSTTHTDPDGRTCSLEKMSAGGYCSGEKTSGEAQQEWVDQQGSTGTPTGR